MTQTGRRHRGRARQGGRSGQRGRWRKRGCSGVHVTMAGRRGPSHSHGVVGLPGDDLHEAEVTQRLSVCREGHWGALWPKRRRGWGGKGHRARGSVQLVIVNQGSEVWVSRNGGGQERWEAMEVRVIVGGQEVHDDRCPINFGASGAFDETMASLKKEDVTRGRGPDEAIFRWQLWCVASHGEDSLTKVGPAQRWRDVLDEEALGSDSEG